MESSRKDLLSALHVVLSGVLTANDLGMYCVPDRELVSAIAYVRTMLTRDYPHQYSLHSANHVPLRRPLTLPPHFILILLCSYDTSIAQ